MRFLIYIFILIAPSLQAQDSLRIVGVKSWQLSRLIDDAKLSRTCDSTLNSFIKTLDLSQKTLKISDSLRKEITLSRDTWRFTSEKKDSLLINQAAQNKIDLRLQRKKSFKKGIGVGVCVFVLVEIVKML